MQTAYVLCPASRLNLFQSSAFLASAVNEASGTLRWEGDSSSRFQSRYLFGELWPLKATNEDRCGGIHMLTCLSLPNALSDRGEKAILLASSGNIGYGSEESCVLHVKVFDMHLGGKKQFIPKSYKPGFYV